MTYEEKLQLVEKIRNTSNLPEDLPEFTKSYMEQVDCEERWVDTSQGKSHIYVIRVKGQKGIKPLYINIHGGGFVKGHFDRDLIFCGEMALRTGCTVIDVDYRLAPEFPYPTSVLECYDVVKWAFNSAGELSIDPQCVIVGGHSSGGNLTAAVALKANQTREFRMRMQILDYPPMDVYTDPADKDPDTAAAIAPEQARAYNALYAEDPEMAKSPFASPVFATPDMLKGLPEALIITAGRDALKREAEKYGSMLAAAGVKVTMQSFLESRHGFMSHYLDQYKEGHDLYANRIKEVCKEYYAEKSNR